MRNTAATTPGATAAPSRGVHIALWVLQVIVAIGFISGGAMKVGGTQQMVDVFTEVGAGQWFRYFVGVLELAGGIGLLIPRLCGLAALGLVALVIGATITNLFVLDEAPWLPLGYLVAAALIAWGRWSRTTALVASLRR